MTEAAAITPDEITSSHALVKLPPLTADTIEVHIDAAERGLLDELDTDELLDGTRRAGALRRVAGDFRASKAEVRRLERLSLQYRRGMGKRLLWLDVKPGRPAKINVDEDDNKIPPPPGGWLDFLGITRDQSSAWQKLAVLPPHEWNAWLQTKLDALAEAGDGTKRGTKRDTGNGNGVSEQAGYASDEWFSPAEVVEQARAFMRNPHDELDPAFDLDPASTETANQTIRARKYYTKELDGLDQPWGSVEAPARVFLNPPYSSPDCGRFIDKLCDELDAGHVVEAFVIVNASTSSEWFHKLCKRGRVCFPKRLRFRHETDPETAQAGNRYAQALVYIGDRGLDFPKAFAVVAGKPALVGTLW